MNWFYADGGKQVGPVSETDFESLVQAGTVRAETLVWREGMSDWQPYSQASGNAAPATGAHVACAECGRVVPQDDAIRYGDAWVCAACKPSFVQKLKEGGTVAGVLEYAGFWIRFGAAMLDWVILYVVNTIISTVFNLFIFRAVSTTGSRGGRTGTALALLGLVFALEMGIAITYETFFVGKYGATPGKMACKLRVVTPEGGPVTYMTAFGRYFAKILSSMIFCIGYIMIGTDKEEHRGLHDRICNTRVVKR